jgi:hypothetical protein
MMPTAAATTERSRMELPVIGQYEADAPDRLDQRRFAELAAQIGDVAVDRVQARE